MDIKLLTKNYNGIFISWNKEWKGIYFSVRGFYIRIFLWGIDFHFTGFNKYKKREKNG